MNLDGDLQKIIQTPINTSTLTDIIIIISVRLDGSWILFIISAWIITSPSNLKVNRYTSGDLTCCSVWLKCVHWR